MGRYKYLLPMAAMKLTSTMQAYLPEALLIASTGRDDINLSVEVVDYPDFVTAVMSHSPDNEMWCRLLHADAIIGGPALNENYMSAFHSLSLAV